MGYIFYIIASCYSDYPPFFCSSKDLKVFFIFYWIADFFFCILSKTPPPDTLERFSVYVACDCILSSLCLLRNRDLYFVVVQFVKLFMNYGVIYMKSLHSLITQGSSIFFWKFSGYVSIYDPFWIFFKYTARCGLRFMYFSWSPTPFFVKTNLSLLNYFSIRVNELYEALSGTLLLWLVIVYPHLSNLEPAAAPSVFRETVQVCVFCQQVCMCMRMSAAIGGQEGASDSLGNWYRWWWAHMWVPEHPHKNHWANSMAPHSTYQTVESSNITLLF